MLELSYRVCFISLICIKYSYVSIISNSLVACNFNKVGTVTCKSLRFNMLLPKKFSAIFGMQPETIAEMQKPVLFSLNSMQIVATGLGYSKSTLTFFRVWKNIHIKWLPPAKSQVTTCQLPYYERRQLFSRRDVRGGSPSRDCVFVIQLRMSHQI